MIVTAKINIESPTGLRIVRELEKHKKVVQLEFEKPLGIDRVARKTYPAEEVFEEGWDLLSELYGVDMRNL